MSNQHYSTQFLYKKIIVVLFLSLFISGCLTSPEFVKINDRAVVTIDPELFLQPVPINELMGLTVVPMSINGVTGFEFLLDTGAAGTVIFESSKTRALNFKTKGTFKVGGSGDGSKVLARIGSDVDLTIGGATINRMSPLIMKWKDIPIFASGDDVYIDGIIGYDLFSRLTVDVNPKNKTVTLYQPGQPSTLSAVNSIKLPIKKGLMTNRLIHSNIKVTDNSDSKSYSKKVLVDTGYTGSLRLMKSKNGVKVASDARTSISAGMQGDSLSYSANLDNINVAGVVLRNVPAAIETKGSGYNDALLGVEVFNKFRHIIDYKNKQILLIPQTVEEPFSTITFGLSALPKGDHFIVSTLTETSPAFVAGLRNKDKIMSINGLSKKDFSFRALANLKPKEGDQIDVCFVRDKLEEQCIEVIAF